MGEAVNVGKTLSLLRDMKGEISPTRAKLFLTVKST